MDQINVLVVDDSSLMRKLITKMVEEDPQIRVVDTAFNGLFALKKIEKLDPDIILLDIEMPEMNGIKFLETCKELNIDIPVIVLSSTGKNRPEITVKCLNLGAKDFILKPSGTISLDIATVQKDVISKIKFFALDHAKHSLKKSDLHHKIQTIEESKPSPIKQTRTNARDPIITENKLQFDEKVQKLHHIEVLAIGISTGGPHALRKIIPVFPKDFPLPILIVQHMPAGFTLEFAKGLNEISQLKVKEAENGDVIMPGNVYIAPGDYHIKIQRSVGENTIVLDTSDACNGHRPSAEVLYKSVTQNFQKHSIQVIMTGMGKDGAAAINESSVEGALTLAQSERTCVVYGMPKVAIDMGGIDSILDLEDIPHKIMEITKKVMG